ncbi:imm11 family protein [Yoonia sp. 208BN28-4]|uniref:imm11 family protein n=1 Tax=Yoonia sp. 208BN28-4 TaxID=3126505 RepID=UPI0030ADE242
MAEPRRFGEYFLDGDYVGWKDALRDALQNEISDDEKARYDTQYLPSYALHVALKFTGITKNEIDHPRAPEPLRPFEVPREFVIEHEHSKRFGSLIKLTDRLLAVDQDLMDVIESLEPGLHQFWPIDIKHADGTPAPKAYFGMRIRQFIDSFRPDQSPTESWTGETGTYYIFDFTRKHCAALSVSKADIGSAHLWRERKLRSPALLLSDELVSRIKEKELRLPNVHQLNEI